MYSLATFFKDFKDAIKRVKWVVAMFIISMQISVGIVVSVVMTFGAHADIFNIVLYAWIFPAVLVWIPVLIKHWVRSE